MYGWCVNSMGHVRSRIHDFRDRIFTVRDTFVAVQDNLGTAHTQRDMCVPGFMIFGTESLQYETLLLLYGTTSGQRTLNGTGAFQDSCFAGQNLYSTRHFCCCTGQTRDSAHSTGQVRSWIHDFRDRIFTVRDMYGTNEEDRLFYQQLFSFGSPL